MVGALMIQHKTSKGDSFSSGAFLVGSRLLMAHATTVFHQPKPFYMIFSLEFWERFGFSGVQAILAVYFVRKLGYSEAEADMVFGSFFRASFWICRHWWQAWRCLFRH